MDCFASLAKTQSDDKNSPEVSRPEVPCQTTIKQFNSQQLNNITSWQKTFFSISNRATV